MLLFSAKQRYHGKKNPNIYLIFKLFNIYIYIFILYKYIIYILIFAYDNYDSEYNIEHTFTYTMTIFICTTSTRTIYMNTYHDHRCRRLPISAWYTRSHHNENLQLQSPKQCAAPKQPLLPMSISSSGASFFELGDALPQL